MAEIDDKELALLRGAKQLMDKLSGSKTRHSFEKLVKEHYPDVQTTEDLAAPYVQRLDELGKKIEALSDRFKKNDDDATESRFQSDIKQLMNDRGYTPEGIDKLKKLMIEKTIPDIIVAADHYERVNPPTSQTPSTFAPTDWGFGKKTDDKNLSLLFQDEDAWAEQEAKAAWDEETRKKGQILT